MAFVSRRFEGLKTPRSADLLKRYGTSVNGRPYIKAKIYTSDEHRINRDFVDQDAMHIVRILQKHGFSAYIVGGAVRDLLLGRTPKDFDIATDAQPRRIRALFANSRVIGKRFRLVHVHFKGDKVIEVSTYRADSAEENVFGTIEEDVRRRDFTFNGLFYCPIKNQVVDYCDGFEHIRKKKLVPILDPKTMFIDDPVRMIRAVKYSVTTGFPISWSLSGRIRKNSVELSRVSVSRLTEELMKILNTGLMEPVLKKLQDYRLLSILLPVHAALSQKEPYRSAFSAAVSKHDKAVGMKEDLGKSDGFVALCRTYVEERVDWSLRTDELLKSVFYLIKEFLKPLTPPNALLERAAALLVEEKRPRKPKHRGRGKINHQ
jgi:poly(A) polymerase